MQQAITAKRKNESPTDLIPTGAVDRLDALGQLLYGEQWITPMARDLKLHPDMIAQWAWGRTFAGALAHPVGGSQYWPRRLLVPPGLGYLGSVPPPDGGKGRNAILG
jgi:hypothetical protein